MGSSTLHYPFGLNLPRGHTHLLGKVEVGCLMQVFCKCRGPFLDGGNSRAVTQNFGIFCYMIIVVGKKGQIGQCVFLLAI